MLHGKLYALPAMLLRQALEQDTVIYDLAVILLTLLICYPFYLFVERPFMSGNYVKINKKHCPYKGKLKSNLLLRKFGLTLTSNRPDLIAGLVVIFSVLV